MRYIIITLCLLCSVSAFAQQQSRADLEAKKKEIMDAINETQRQLDETKQNKNATIGQLRALQNKLAERQKLIGNINDEIGDIDNNIKSSSTEVTHLKGNLEQLKIHYAQSIRYAYETRSNYGMLAYMFSSSDFNDAMRRMKYLKKLRELREQQVEQIRITQAQLTHKIGVLNAAKAQKDELLNSQMQQKQVLVKETDETNKVVKDLKGREKELLTQITKNKKTAAKVNKSIQEVIQREIEIAARKAEEEEEKRKAAAAATAAANTHKSNIKTTTTYINIPADKTANSNNPKATKVTKTTKTKPESNAVISMTPEVAALSNNFENNKGRLPWPVEKGFISDHFGQHPHPIAEHVMIDNAGVDIRTSPGATARAIFDGRVSKSFYMPGYGWTVIIIHGSFYSVYGGLSSINVKADQQVKAKTPIGMIGDNDDGEPTIHFQIWKSGKTAKSSLKLNPESWILPMR